MYTFDVLAVVLAGYFNDTLYAKSILFFDAYFKVLELYFRLNRDLQLHDAETALQTKQQAMPQLTAALAESRAELQALTASEIELAAAESSAKKRLGTATVASVRVKADLAAAKGTAKAAAKIEDSLNWKSKTLNTALEGAECRIEALKMELGELQKHRQEQVGATISNPLS